MKFRVTGSSKQTGARMTLEFDAASKAAAEKKAQNEGMAVNRVEVLGDPADFPAVGLKRPQNHWLLRTIIVLAISIAMYYWCRNHGIIR